MSIRPSVNRRAFGARLMLPFAKKEDVVSIWVPMVNPIEQVHPLRPAPRMCRMYVLGGGAHLVWDCLPLPYTHIEQETWLQRRSRRPCLQRQAAWSLDSTISKFLYSKKEIKKVFLIVCHTSDSNLQYSDPESMGRVATPCGDLLYDLLTPCVGTLKSIAFTIYELQLIQPAGYTICRWFLVGRDMTSLKTITCEARPF